MPSPFPGMDPFIEYDCWNNFHSRMILSIADDVVHKNDLPFVATIDDIIYPFVPPPGSNAKWIGPPPKQHHVCLRRCRDPKPFTIITMLCPTTKGGSGTEKYIRHREDFLRQGMHLVEIDLLRLGEKLPAFETVAVNNFGAVVTRADQPANAQIYQWSLTDRLPRIGIPLADGVPDVELDLQEAFDGLYHRAGFDYALPYDMRCMTNMSAEQLAWVESCLAVRAKTKSQSE